MCDRSGCGVVWCGVVWCGVVWCGVVWCFVDVVCAEDAQAHAAASQKLYRWNILLEYPHRLGKRSARRTEADAVTVLVIIVDGRSGKYAVCAVTA